jgi:hypothetical protein
LDYKGAQGEIPPVWWCQLILNLLDGQIATTERGGSPLRHWEGTSLADRQREFTTAAVKLLRIVAAGLAENESSAI